MHFRNQFENELFREPGHRLLEVRDRRLNEIFGNDRVIRLEYDMEWRTRWPDLTPYYFFLWGYLKGKVFSRPPHDVNMLRQRILAQFNALRNNLNFISI